MAEMTATFEPTLEVRELLEGRPAEYIVVNPVAIEAKIEDGRVVRYPQEIRERIVRCRDCKYAEGDTRCTRFHEADQDGYGHYPADICPDGFCAWASEREQSE